MVVEIHRIDAKPRGQKLQVSFQALRCRQCGLAAKHRCHAAEGAAKAATQGCLVAGRAPPEIGSGEIAFRAAQAFIGKDPGKAGGGECAIFVVYDPIAAAPGQAVNRGEGLFRAAKMRIESPPECVLPLAPDGVVHVWRIEAGFGADGGKMPSPDDGRRRKPCTNRARYGYGGAKLRSPHDAHTDRIDASALECAQCGGDEVAIDIAIDDAGLVVTVEGCGKIQYRKRKPGAAPRGNRRVDQYYVS